MKIVAYNFLFLFIFLSCSSDTKFSDVSIGVTDFSHSKYHIKFKTDTDKEANISYWDNENDKKITDNYPSDNYDIPLPFLKPSTQYSFMINSENSNSILYSFKTKDLPSNFPSFELKKDSLFNFDGYLLFRTQTNPGIQFMMDDSGNITWYSIADSTLSRPFNKGNNFSYLSQSEKTLFHEISFNGDTLFSKNTDSEILHHDILRNDSMFVALTYEYIDFNSNEFDSLMGDGIVIYDLKGNKIWKWNIFDHVDPTSESFIIREDWSHANAIDVDYDGNFLVSFRNFDQIWKISSVSGEILWRLGINGDFQLENSDVFYQQHAIHKIDKNNYMLFDNGSSEFRNTSRALIFEIDELNSKFKKVKSVFLPDDLFSFKQGSVYLLDDKYFLFSSSVNNRTVISDNKGKILWDLSSDHSYYRVYYIDKNFITN